MQIRVLGSVDVELDGSRVKLAGPKQRAVLSMLALIAEDLRGVQSDVRDALRRHDLPAVPVHVMLTGFERRTRRELD